MSRSVKCQWLVQAFMTLFTSLFAFHSSLIFLLTSVSQPLQNFSQHKNHIFGTVTDKKQTLISLKETESNYNER